MHQVLVGGKRSLKDKAAAVVFVDWLAKSAQQKKFAADLGDLTAAQAKSGQMTQVLSGLAPLFRKHRVIAYPNSLWPSPSLINDIATAFQGILTGQNASINSILKTLKLSLESGREVKPIEVNADCSADDCRYRSPRASSATVDGVGPVSLLWAGPAIVFLVLYFGAFAGGAWYAFRTGMELMLRPSSSELQTSPSYFTIRSPVQQSYIR